MRVTTYNHLAVAAVLFAMVGVRVCRAETPPDSEALAQGVFCGVRGADFPWEGRTLRIILGQVDHRFGETDPLTYDATVLLEFRQSILPGSEIKIRGVVKRPGSMAFDPIPTDWSPGTLFLMTIATTNDSTKFEYAAGGAIMGVDMPCSVNPEQVALLKPAMLKLGEIAALKDSIPSTEEAEKLFQAEDNYYLWAIGATAIAARGDQAAELELQRRWRNPTKPLLSPRQIVWLDYCFSRIPEAVSLNPIQRHQMLLEYLERLADVQQNAGPTSKPQGDR